MLHRLAFARMRALLSLAYEFATFLNQTIRVLCDHMPLCNLCYCSAAMTDTDLADSSPTTPAFDDEALRLAFHSEFKLSGSSPTTPRLEWTVKAEDTTPDYNELTGSSPTTPRVEWTAKPEEITPEYDELAEYSPTTPHLPTAESLVVQ